VEEDLNALVTNGISEGRTIDYKEQLDISQDAEKKELLADIMSFANASGGDLVFGITPVDCGCRI
jgi:predicted HTH transcriptional regulator